MEVFYFSLEFIKGSLMAPLAEVAIKLIRNPKNLTKTSIAFRHYRTFPYLKRDFYLKL